MGFLWAQAQLLTPTSFFRRNAGKLKIREDLSENNIEWGEEKADTISVVFYCWESTSKEEIEQFSASVKALWNIEVCHFFLHKDTGTYVRGCWIANPYVLVDFIRTPSFPITQAQRVLAENEWNKYEAAIKVLTEDIGKDYTPRDFVPPDSWKHPPLDFMTELFASTTGKEQYTGRSNKANFRKKSIEDYIIRMRKNRQLWERKLFPDKLKCQKFLNKVQGAR